MTTYSESYWRRREEADDERERPEVGDLDVISGGSAGETTPQPVKPTFGPVEPPPPTPEPEPEPEPFPGLAPTRPAPPAAEKTSDKEREMRLKAIGQIQRLGDEPIEAPEGLRDSDIAAAGDRDRQRVRGSNLTEALQAMLQRRPQRMQQEPSESAQLLQRQTLAGQRSAQALGRKMTAAEKIAAALKGGKGDELTTYQIEQIKRNAVLDEQRRGDKDEAQKLHNLERSEDVEARRVAHDDAVRLAEQGQKIAGANLGLHGRQVNLQENEVERKKTEGMPFGWTLRAGANPSPEQRKQAFDIATAQKTLDVNTRDLERVLALPPSIDREKRLNQKVQEIGNQIRVMEGLGVPSGPDTIITSQITGDPAGVISRLTSDGPRAMAELRRYGTVKVNSVADTLGAEVGNQPGQGGGVTLRRKDTKETKTFPADVAEQLLKNPNFERAD